MKWSLLLEGNGVMRVIDKKYRRIKCTLYTQNKSIHSGINVVYYVLSYISVCLKPMSPAFLELHFQDTLQFHQHTYQQLISANVSRGFPL